MLSIRKLSKSYGGRVLFRDADLQINSGDRVAIVGPNGAGKSTLFKIILKKEEADSGDVERDEWSTLGFLEQEGAPAGNETVLEVATGRAGELQKLEEIMRKHEEDGSTGEPEYLEAGNKFDALNDPGFEAKVKRMLRGLGYKQEDFDRPLKELSGGWIMRAHLARLLAIEPDLLMLDEPTNHLDLLSLLWFQNYLKSYPGAILMISHDREFMDQVVTRIHDMDRGKLVAYDGNYSAFLKEREARFQREWNAWKNQQKEISELQAFADKFRSVASKASQAMSKLKQIERMEKLEKPTPAKKPFRFNFPQPPRGGQRVISLENIVQAYGDRVIYNGLNLDIEKGERTVLVGPNGAGKSTLLKIIADVIPIRSGDRKPGHNLKMGYFSQHRTETLSPQKTVLQEVVDAAPDIKEDEARGILGSFLFKREDVFKKVEVLSGGEKSRLSLVKFLVNPPNLLLMDEPTTHLDLLSVEGLILALQKFEGTLVFISHDVHFIRSLATKVIHVNDGKVTPYAGGYDYFLEKNGADLINAREAIVS